MYRFLIAAGCLVAANATASAQPRLTAAQQREVQQLRADLARARTQMSAADSQYRAAQAQTRAALDRVRNGFGAASISSQVLTALGPVGSIAKVSTWTARAYDAAVASVRAGRFTTTASELQTLLTNLERARLDATAPYVNRITTITTRLRQLGISNP